MQLRCVFKGNWALAVLLIVQINASTSSLQLFADVFRTHDRVEVCSDVGVGLFSVQQGSNCECGFGFEPNGQSCQKCALSQYKDQVGNTACLPCGANKGTLPGTEDATLCLCSPGFRDDGAGGCVECAANTYKPHYANDACLSCHLNHVSPAGEISITACQCDAGYTIDATASDLNLKCVQCDYSTFKPLSGPQECTECPLNSETLERANVNADACVCSAGYELNAESNCEACEEGFFKPTADNAGCTTCGNLETTLHEGSTSQTQCVCEAGSTRNIATGECELCGPGTYKATAGDAECLPCNGASFAAPGSLTCASCPLHSRSDTGNVHAGNIGDCVCDAGYRRDGDACVACAVGTFKASAGNAPTCEPCAANKYQDQLGRPECEDCMNNAVSAAGSTSISQCLCEEGYAPDGALCSPCEAGSIKSTTGNEVCVECVRGKYSMSTTECQDCPDNSHTVHAGSDGIDDCLCVAAFQKSGTQCETCDAGFYCSGNDNRQACMPHSSSPAGSTSQAACVCENGRHLDQGACAVCPVEHFCTNNEIHHCFDHSNSAVGKAAETDCTCNAGYERKAA